MIFKNKTVTDFYFLFEFLMLLFSVLLYFSFQCGFVCLSSAFVVSSVKFDFLFISVLVFVSLLLFVI